MDPRVNGTDGPRGGPMVLGGGPMDPSSNVDFVFGLGVWGLGLWIWVSMGSTLNPNKPAPETL